MAVDSNCDQLKLQSNLHKATTVKITQKWSFQASGSIIKSLFKTVINQCCHFEQEFTFLQFHINLKKTYCLAATILALHMKYNFW